MGLTRRLCLGFIMACVDLRLGARTRCGSVRFKCWFGSGMASGGRSGRCKTSVWEAGRLSARLV